MEAKELKAVHAFHEKFSGEWGFLMAAYEGVRALIDWGVLKKHERESEENYKARVEETFGFGYSRSIVDLFNYYLFKKPAQRELGDLGKDETWAAFVDDADLYGTDLDTFLLEQQKDASIYGHMGILVDKPTITAQTRQEEKEQGVYPYLAAYPPQSILDWKYEHLESGRPFLSYLKLQDEDGRYRIWTVDKWEVWEIPVDDKGKEGDPVLISSGENTLGSIPFLWLYNAKTRRRNIGASDVSEVARIDASILRNLSHGEEVIKYAAFPMMIKPVLPSSVEGDDVAGVTAVLEFDPNFPESKPDWLEAKCKEPIEAILSWIDRKVQEIYRASNAGGLQSVEISKQAKSGVALKQEFQLLNAKLAGKAKNLEEAEKGIIYFWLLWQGQDGWYKAVSIERSKNFDVEDLATDLDNALTAKSLIVSTRFQAALQKMLARQILPGVTDADMKAIDGEIDALAGKPRKSVREEVDEGLEAA